MPTVQFLGKILPSVVDITFTDVPTVNWESKDIDLKMSFKIEVNKSSVRVVCEVSRYETSVLPHLFMRAFDLARAAVDLACFSSGIGATVFLETLVDPYGNRSTLLAQDQRLVNACTAFRAGPPPNPDMTTILNAVLTEPPLFMALNDLIAAIALPHHSSVTCARAVERLRNIIAPSASRKDSWESLRRNLNIERDYVEFVTSHSTGPRHGDPQHVPGTITMEITLRAWNIMNRFLEFRKRNNVALPISEFPMLT